MFMFFMLEIALKSKFFQFATLDYFTAIVENRDNVKSL